MYVASTKNHPHSINLMRILTGHTGLTVGVVHGEGQAVAKRVVHVRLHCPDSVWCSAPIYVCQDALLHIAEEGPSLFYNKKID